MNRCQAVAELIKNNTDFIVKSEYGKEFDDITLSQAVSKNQAFIVYGSASPVGSFEDNSPIYDYNFVMFVQTTGDKEDTINKLSSVLTSNMVESDYGDYAIVIDGVSFDYSNANTVINFNFHLTYIGK